MQMVCGNSRKSDTGKVIQKTAGTLIPKTLKAYVCRLNKKDGACLAAS